MSIIKKFLIALALAAAIGLFLYQNNNSWRALYKKDLKATYEILKENHPGFYDDQNPDFKAWLADGYAQALRRADQITSSVDYLNGLQFFVNGFKDHHLRLMYDPAILIPDDSSKSSKKDNAFLLASVKEIGPQQVWITIPSFHPETSEQEQALTVLADSMMQYKQYDTIIFDVRGNGGGNSYYGEMILKNLYGEPYCNAAFKRMSEKQYVEWRASQGNVDYLKNLLVTLEQKFGQESEITTEFSVIASEMEKNLLAGNHFYRALSGSTEAAEVPVLQNLLHARIIVITDTQCASSCLDFLDQLFALGPVLQVGLATSVDTDYMECRDEKLPSSLVTLHFPIKVFRNRSRKSNQAYVPQIFVQDVYNDDELRRVIFPL